MKNVILQSLGLDLVNISVYAQVYQNIPHSSFSLFQNLELGKNVILQSLGLDLVNVNVYAKNYQNIPLSSRDRAIFTFSEFGARQSLDR